jgi:hypothetical protein
MKRRAKAKGEVAPTSGLGGLGEEIGAALEVIERIHHTLLRPEVNLHGRNM